MRERNYREMPGGERRRTRDLVDDLRLPYDEEEGSGDSSDVVANEYVEPFGEGAEAVRLVYGELMPTLPPRIQHLVSVILTGVTPERYSKKVARPSHAEQMAAEAGVSVAVVERARMLLQEYVLAETRGEQMRAATALRQVEEIVEMKQSRLAQEKSVQSQVNEGPERVRQACERLAAGFERENSPEIDAELRRLLGAWLQEAPSSMALHDRHFYDALVRGASLEAIRDHLSIPTRRYNWLCGVLPNLLAVLITQSYQQVDSVVQRHIDHR